ncbi:response regulator transcription factor [Microtetraspora fusca]|uniref:response regulator transcription factor n=1 Tax=Microtetraspora fusca TaxID=1997 RepID=UPI00083252A3|nr:response regulator transcription factor [Microtetraspora fusca]
MAADTALLWLDGTRGWTLAAYAVAVALTMAAMNRLPFAAFLAALVLAVLTDGSLALLVCTGFQAGHRISARRDVVVTACALTPDELIRAVRAAHAGQAYLSPAVTRQVLDMAAPGDHERGRDAARRLAALTAREADILALVAQGLSNAQVARRIHMTEASVKTYVSRILAKLNCTNRVQAALLLRDAPSPRECSERK